MENSGVEWWGGKERKLPISTTQFCKTLQEDLCTLQYIFAFRASVGFCFQRAAPVSVLPSPPSYEQRQNSY